MINLSTHYLGFGLKNPLVVSSSPLTKDIDNIRLMEDAEAAAIVLHSLFEEQISVEQTQSQYLEHIRNVKEAVSIPVIASLNASCTGSWVSYAKQIEQAGGDAIELNIYHLPIDPEDTGVEIEQRYLDTVWDVKANISIPIAVKINPYFSSIANMAQRLDKAGADGLVLFNRFYMPDFDLENHDIVAHLTLSNSNELPLRLYWASILFGNLTADIAVTGGVHTAKDMIKSIMAGANVTMMTSALLKFGIHHINEVLYDLEFWLATHGYESIMQIRGRMSRKSIHDSTVNDRANYMKVLNSYVPRLG